ncbi:MAG: flavodoxin-dependent (E)-4-hydroxy-3-methylbut-2-enyl-diphosphate synthase [Oscillospiraceae bacterium]
MSKIIKIGNTKIGGGNPIAIQSMLNVHNSDADGNIAQAMALESAGCEIIRVAVPNMEAVRLIPAIKSAVKIPLVADIHFDYRLAVESAAAGVDKIRINPGNIGEENNVKAVVQACRARGIPIRIGVNSGSLEKEILAKYEKVCPEALVESARRHIELLEKFDFYDIVVSIKSSDVMTMVKSCELFASIYDYPLHIGVTESGTYENGIVKSAVGIGALLCEGIGDTVRVSLTDDPLVEIGAAKKILSAAGVRKFGINVVSCPTCGRTEVDLVAIAREVEKRCSGIEKQITVAVMGCVVNGPGEAACADIGIAGGKDCAVLFKKGVMVRKLTGDIAGQLMEEIEKM